MIDRPSPNHNARTEGQPVDILLLHYTGMQSAEAALARMCDPEAEVSAHYCIDEDGTLFRLVPEDRRAWHAGRAFWAGASDINARSIGIELVNPGREFGYRPFPEPQMAALLNLAGEILARHPIPAARVLGHSDVAPLRKEDPGELFDWPRLAQAGIGIWPEPASHDDRLAEQDVGPALAHFGYGYLDEDPAAVIRAFQRHFVPETITGVADDATRRRLAAVLRQLDGTPGEA